MRANPESRIPNPESRIPNPESRIPNPMPAIRAICFDLDNTLWDVWPVIHRAERAMYEFLKERYPRVVAEMTIEAMRAARERVALEHPQMQHDFTFLRKQSLRDHARLA